MTDVERMLKLDALVRAERAEAECRRLREKLDAAVATLNDISAGCWNPRLRAHAALEVVRP